MSYPIISSDPRIQAHYVASRELGTTHLLAEMFALGQPPQSRTDKEFLSGHCNGNQFENRPQDGNFYAAVARHGGVDPKGKVYLSQLANFPGDPAAWVSGRSDVERICRERGWGCEGLVDAKLREPAEAPKLSGIKLAEDLVQGHINEIVTEHPEAAIGPHALDDLREKVIDTHAPKWAE